MWVAVGILAAAAAGMLFLLGTGRGFSAERELLGYDVELDGPLGGGYDRVYRCPVCDKWHEPEVYFQTGVFCDLCGNHFRFDKAEKGWRKPI